MEKAQIIRADNNTYFKEIHTDQGISINIPSKGFKGKGLAYVSIISFWLTTILIWSIVLVLMKPIYGLYALPFWAIGIITLIKSVKVLKLEQNVIVNESSLILQMKRGEAIEEMSFPIKGVIVELIEGTYYSYSGLNRRGVYPAIIYNEEAFGFGERLNESDKKQIVNLINRLINN